MWHDDPIVKPFRIYNTLSRTVEEVKPGNPPDITYYSCGPTVYLPQHLGNMRAYLFVDTLKRALRFNGWNVRHVMNITDVGHMTSDEDAGEDKIEKTARAEGKTPLEVANFYIDQFKRDCARLNIELPEPPLLCRATDHVDDMIALIERILKNGLAYVTPSGVYFDVEKWRGPGGRGRLSRQSLDEQQGNRLEHSTDKRSPHDFALWVLNQPHHMMQWDSPWGRGYPGWHIECSAMSMKYLGETLDIHSGGLDHIPVHHENEIAQSEGATGNPFVRYFVHNAFLVGMEGAKISKSAGKFPVLDDLIREGIEPLAFRWLCLMAKYRSELRFDDEVLRAAQNSLHHVRKLLADLPIRSKSDSDAEWVGEYERRFHDALNDDLNTSEALSVVIEMIRRAHGDVPGYGADARIWGAVRRFDVTLGTQLEGGSDSLRTAQQGIRLAEMASANNKVSAFMAEIYRTPDSITATQSIGKMLDMGAAFAKAGTLMASLEAANQKVANVISKLDSAAARGSSDAIAAMQAASGMLDEMDAALIITDMMASLKTANDSMSAIVATIDNLNPPELANAIAAIHDENRRISDTAAFSIALERKRMRAVKRFKESDELRRELFANGYLIEDVTEAPGFRLSRNDKSDPP